MLELSIYPMTKMTKIFLMGLRGSIQLAKIVSNTIDPSGIPYLKGNLVWNEIFQNIFDYV